MSYKNYNLNKKSRSFLQQIETDYGQHIQIVEKELGPAEHGFSKIENGVPIIEIARKEKYKEEIIIHEAYHLRLRYDGMPDIGFDLQSGTNTENNRFYLKWFVHLFWDKINHHYFYGKIKKELLIDPYKSTKQELDDIFQEDEIKNLKEATKEISLSGYYLQSWLETQDEEYMERFAQFLKDRYGGLGVEKGGSLITMFKDKPLICIEDCVEIFNKIFDYIHQDQGIRITNRRDFSEDRQNYIQKRVSFTIGT